MESAYYLQYNDLIDFSTQQLLDCVRTEICQGCEGGFYDSAWQNMKQINTNIKMEKDYPYTGLDNQTCNSSTGLVFT